MAAITTVDGTRFLFDPDGISIITDRDAQTGINGTMVYGLMPQGLRITESVDQLLQRLNLTSAFAKLSQADGSSVLINGKSAGAARQAFAGEYEQGVHTVIFVGASAHAVREPLDEVQQAINHAGGKL